MTCSGCGPSNMAGLSCPHCMHPWGMHEATCTACGCMWPNPADIPEPPPPPTVHEELIANIENTIWNDLERQAEAGMGPYVDREMGMVDASGAGVDMTAVAASVAKLFVDIVVPQLHRD